MIWNKHSFRKPKGKPIVRHGTPPTPEDPYSSSQVIEEYPDGSSVVSNLPITERDVEEYRNAIEEYPQSGSIRIQFAVILMYLGRLEDARIQAEEAVALDPDGGFSHSTLSAILKQMGDLGLAIAE